MTSYNTSQYNAVNISCTNCSTTFMSRSTHDGDIRVEVCSNCHPAYTGQQRIAVSSSQVDKFNERYAGK